MVVNAENGGNARGRGGTVEICVGSNHRRVGAVKCRRTGRNKSTTAVITTPKNAGKVGCVV